MWILFAMLFCSVENKEGLSILLDLWTSVYDTGTK